MGVSASAGGLEAFSQLLAVEEMDGYEVARRLRKIPGMEKILIIALTGYGQDEDRQRSRDAGFDQHLVKPITVAMLKRALSVTTME